MLPLRHCPHVQTAVASPALPRRWSRQGDSLLMTTRSYKKSAVSLQALRITLFPRSSRFYFQLKGL
jgi:hypothetical protein